MLQLVELCERFYKNMLKSEKTNGTLKKVSEGSAETCGTSENLVECSRNIHIIKTVEPHFLEAINIIGNYMGEDVFIYGIPLQGRP